MDKTVLVVRDLANATEILEALDRANLDIRVAVWAYLHEYPDWRLVLAAYSAGEGTVQKLLDRFKTDSYDAIAEHLPAETQMYVPRVEALLLKREGASLEQLSAPPTGL